MRNMKSLHIFLIIVIKREEKFQGSRLEYENPKVTLEYEKTMVNVAQRSPWNYIYVTFSFMRRAITSLLILSVDQLMRVDYSPYSLESFEL